jgi:hypothetical protein
MDPKDVERICGPLGALHIILSWLNEGRTIRAQSPGSASFDVVSGALCGLYVAGPLDEERPAVGTTLHSFTREHLIATLRIMDMNERRGKCISDDDYYSMNVDELAKMQTDDLLSTLGEVQDVEP